MFRYLFPLVLSLIAKSAFAQNQSSTGDCSPNILTRSGNSFINCYFGDAGHPERPPEIKAILEKLDRTEDVVSATGDLIGFAKRTSSFEDRALAYLTASQIQSSLGNIELSGHLLKSGKARLPAGKISRLLYSEQAFKIGKFGMAFQISKGLFDELILDQPPKEALLDAAEVLVISSLELGKVVYAREVLSETLRAAFADGEVFDEYRSRFDFVEARILSSEGNSDAAMRVAGNALTLTTQKYGDNHFETAQAMLTSAEIYFNSGGYARSAELARRASNIAFQVGLNPDGFHGRSLKLASQAYAAVGEKTLASDLAKKYYFSAVQFQRVSDEAVFEAASFTVDLLRRLRYHQDAAGILAHAISLQAEPIRIIGTEAYLNVPYIRIVAEVAAIECAPPTKNPGKGLKATYLNSLIALRSEPLNYNFLEEAIEVMMVQREPTVTVVC